MANNLTGAENVHLNSLLYASVIDLIGSGSFFSGLSEFIEHTVPYDGLIVFLYTGKSAPSALGCFKSGLDFQSGLENYLKFTYVLNPVYRAFQSKIDSGTYLITELMPDRYNEQVANSDLRIRIEDNEVIGYRTPGWPKNMTDVLGLVQLPGEILVEFDFITSPTNDQTNRCLQALRSIFPILSSAVRKHFEIVPQEFEPGNASPSHEDRFQAFGKSVLTRREQSVVKMVLTGHSSNSIALSLGISMPTVKSHRRNVYAKLNISSQAELFNLFIHSLTDKAA